MGEFVERHFSAQPHQYDGEFFVHVGEFESMLAGKANIKVLEVASFWWGHLWYSILCCPQLSWKLSIMWSWFPMEACLNLDLSPCVFCLFVPRRPGNLPKLRPAGPNVSWKLYPNVSWKLCPKCVLVFVPMCPENLDLLVPMCCLNYMQFPYYQYRLSFYFYLFRKLLWIFVFSAKWREKQEYIRESVEHLSQPQTSFLSFQ